MFTQQPRALKLNGVKNVPDSPCDLRLQGWPMGWSKLSAQHAQCPGNDPHHSRGSPDGPSWRSSSKNKSKSTQYHDAWFGNCGIDEEYPQGNVESDTASALGDCWMLLDRHVHRHSRVEEKTLNL